MKRLCVVLLILLLLGGCSQATQQSESTSRTDEIEVGGQPAPEKEVFQYYITPSIPQEIQELVVHNREAAFCLDNVSLERIKQDYLSYHMDKEEDQKIAEQLQREFSYISEISIEQAMIDVEFLFGYLKYSYAGYGYFGGDDVFFPMKDSIVEEVIAQGTNIAVEDFEQILAEHLIPLLVDSHFTIGTTRSQQYHAHMSYSVDESVCYTKQEDGFHTEIDGADYLLQSINGGSPKEYVKAALTQDGKMAWVVGISHQISEVPALELTLIHTESGATITKIPDLVMTAQTPDYTMQEEILPYELAEVSGIPVVQSRRLWADGGEDIAALEKLVEDASSLREQPVVIVDLRGNTGGNSEWGERWIEGFSGSRSAYHYIYCVMETQTVASRYGEEYEISLLGWLEPRRMTAEVIPNDQLVLVLTDQHTGSSAELFLEGLLQMENVIVIGTNSNGMMVFGDVSNVYMPESRLKIGCGYKLFLQPDLTFYECVGRSPDLWTPPADALERAVLFAQNYGNTQ